jgi:hypothetical protein
MSPAELLDRLDREARAHEGRARDLRTCSDKLRVEIATAAALLAGNPAPQAKAPAATNGSRPGKPRDKRVVYPAGLTPREKTIYRLRHRGYPDLADQVEAGTMSLNAAEVQAGYRVPEAPRRRQRKPRQRPIANGGDQVPRRRPLRSPSPIDGDPRLDNLSDDRVMKLRRLSRYSADMAEAVLRGEVSLNSMMIQAGLVKPAPPSPAKTSSLPPVPSGTPRSEEPSDPELRDEVNEAMQQERDAAAALDAHRALRRSQEPPVKWSPGVTWPPPDDGHGADDRDPHPSPPASNASPPSP